MRLLIDAAIIAKLSDEFWADTAIVKVVKCSKEDRLLTEHCKIKWTFRIATFFRSLS